MEKSKKAQHMPKMDIVSGEVHSYFSRAKNDIHTREHNFNFTVLASIFKSFVHPTSLILIITVIATSILPEASPFPTTMYAIQLALLVLVSIIQQILSDKVKAEADDLINRRKVKVFRSHTGQQPDEIEWGELRQGDIVKLVQGQTAPADLVLLDSQSVEHREAIAYVDMKSVNGETVCQKKKACNTTQIINKSSSQKRFWPQYKKIITGRITYEKPNASMDSFTGYLKLAKDPKPDKLSIDNLILRESCVKTSLWIYGLVIYPGMESKIMKSFMEGNNCRKWIFNKVDKIYGLLFVLSIVLGTIFTLAYKLAEDRYLSVPFIIAYHFLMFSIVVPHFLYLSRDLYLIFFKHFVKTNEIEVRNYDNMQELGEISFSVMSNIGVLSTGKLQVNEIVTESSVYTLEGEDLAIQSGPKRASGFIPGRRRLGSSLRMNAINEGRKSNMRLMPIFNYDKRNSALLFKEENNGGDIQENFQIDDDSNVRLKETPNLGAKTGKMNHHLQPLKLDKTRLYNYVKRNENQSTEIIKAISLCHQAKFKYVKNKFEGVSNVNSEEVLLKLVKYVGWDLEPDIIDKKEVGLKVLEEKEKIEDGAYRHQIVPNYYHWFGINSFHIPRKLFSVVVSNNDKCTLYCKGKPEDILERLKISKETQKSIEQTVASYQKKQSEVLIYAKKQLSIEEREFYNNDYNSLKYSLTTTEAQINQFSKKYQKDLEFICIISLSTQINPQAGVLVNYLQGSGIKPCIFAQEKAQLNALEEMFVDESEEYHHIELEQGSAELIKYYLNEATNLLHNNKDFKFVLTLSGQGWATIREDSQILQHFLFVLYYSQGLLGTKLNPEDISDFTHQIRYSYPCGQKVLGIGYSYTDLKFLGESNVSIGLSSDLPTDIKVYCLDKIVEALKLGPYFLKAKVFRRSLILYRIIVLSTIVLTYEIILASMASSRTINGSLVLLYSVVYTCLELGYSLFSFKEVVKLDNKVLYQKYKSAERNIMLACGEAFVHGLIIVLGVYYTLPNVRVQTSKILPLEAFDMAIFVILILVSSLRNFFNPKMTKLFFTITTIITLSVMALLVFIISRVDRQFERVAMTFAYLFSAYDSITMIFNLTIFCLSLSMFLEQIMKKSFILEKKESQKEKGKGVTQHRQNMSELIKHLYSEEQHMESSVQEIVSKEMDVNRMKINSNLQIKDEEENIKYLFLSIPKAKIIFIQLCVVLSIFFCLLLGLDVGYTHRQFEDFHAILLIGIGITILAGLMAWKVEMFISYYRFSACSVTCIVILIIAYCFFDWHSGYLLVCLAAALVTQPLNLYFPFQMILCLGVLICGIVTAELRMPETIDKVIVPLLEFVCVLLNFHVIFRGEIDSKASFIITQAFEKQRNYADDILSILVPKFIKNHLEEENDFALQQEQKKVSILFCYVCKFDEIVKEEGTNVVLLMDELFRQFDQLCQNYAVQKIETVGQTYMAATGIKAYEDQIESEIKRKNQVQRLLKMAIQMLEKSKDIRWGIKKNKQLEIKIGINHGNVVIGVIGHHKPQFSLIGDTVNATSRHCSTAAPGKIVISAIAYQLLRQFPASAFKKEKKFMKGLGDVNVYTYTKNELKESNHLKVKVKFEKIVMKVIENLKAEGKIVHRKFQTEELAKMALIDERRTTKKFTRASELRRSLQIEATNDIEGSQCREAKFSDLELKYNMVLQLQQKNPKFTRHLLRKELKSDRLKLGVLAAIYLLIYLIDIGTKNYTKGSLALSSIGIVLFPILYFLSKGALKNRIINIVVVVFHVYLILIMKARSLILEMNSRTVVMENVENLYPLIAITVCSSQSVFRFLHTLSLSITALIMYIVMQAIGNSFEVGIIYQAFYYALILFRKYTYLKASYDNFSQSEIYEKKTQEQSALVSQLLPKHAYEKLKNQNIENRLELTDRFEGATMLFADIKGFTAFSNQSTPVGVVKMLRELFEEFDKLCLKYNVYKVYTIGDCYVVLGFTNCYQRDYLQQAKNVVNMGLAMVETIQRVREALNFHDLDMRIGIHTGTIIGGIIGTQIVRYDIYGPDVLVANKFQEHGRIGFIHISEATKEVLDRDKKKSFNIINNGPVKVEKLSAEYNGYILTKKKFQV